MHPKRAQPEEWTRLGTLAEATELDSCDCDCSEGKEGAAGHGMGSGACLPWSGVYWCGVIRVLFADR